MEGETETFPPPQFLQFVYCYERSKNWIVGRSWEQDDKMNDILLYTSLMCERCLQFKPLYCPRGFLVHSAVSRKLYGIRNKLSDYH